MACFVPSAAPPTALGHLRQLSKRSGVHASPFQLGGMSIGDSAAWTQMGMGEMTKEMSFKLLDTFWESGGNLIDTANFYQDGTSEAVIGEWAETRGIRSEILIATKYTHNYHLPANSVARAAHHGNSLKSMRNSIEDSLKKLRTTYIDIFYVHSWDFEASVEEVMDGLHNLVVQGEVLYLGISNAPAWIVARANAYARLTHKTPFVIYQAMYSILERTAEIEILPLVRDEGMAFAAFGVLCGGKLRSDEEEKKRKETGEGGRNMPWSGGWERSEEEKKVCERLEKVREEVGAKSLTAVAIAWVLHKAQYVFPIIGGRKPEQLIANIEALSISLTDEQIAYLDAAKPVQLGMPYSMIGDGTEYSAMLTASTLSKAPRAPPIRPVKA